MSDDETAAPGVDVLLLGGASAGKTLLVRHLDCLARGVKLTNLHTSVTTGVELDELGSGKQSLAVWEVGAPMAANWHTYFGSSHMIVYLIDMSNPVHVSSGIVELLKVLAHDKTAGTPVLILLNKCDSPLKLSPDMILELMRYEELVATRGDISVLEASAKTGSGLHNVLKWMRDTKLRCVKRLASSR